MSVLYVSFPEKAENALAFLHILLTFRKKKLFPKRPKSLQNSSPTQAFFITVHKYVCIIVLFSERKGFVAIF